MRIVIFGASGKAGQLLVNQALEKQHTVTVFVRNPAKLPPALAQAVTIKEGDMLQPEKVEEAVKEQDAVLIALGTPPGNKNPDIATGTKNIISAMQKMQVKRLICLSGIGVGDSFSEAHIKKKIMIRTILKAVYEDKKNQEDAIKASGLDWTIIHAADLTEGPLTHHYIVAEHLPLQWKWQVSISRADVSEFMLQQIEDSKFVQKTVTIMSN